YGCTAVRMASGTRIAVARCVDHVAARDAALLARPIHDLRRLCAYRVVAHRAGLWPGGGPAPDRGVFLRPVHFARGHRTQYSVCMPAMRDRPGLGPGSGRAARSAGVTGTDAVCGNRKDSR